VLWDIGAIANSKQPGALDLIHKIILASASIPGAFEPVFIDVEADGQAYSEIHTDGGVTSQVFIYPLKMQKGVVDIYRNNHMNRHLFIIRNSKIAPEYKALKPNVLSLSKRSIETLTKYQGIGDLYRLYLGSLRDGIDYNLAYIPEDFAVQPQELFDPYYMSELYKVGYTLGKKLTTWEKTPPGIDYLPDRVKLPH
jgi:predicted acylesterase/phospholipase RssA